MRTRIENVTLVCCDAERNVLHNASLTFEDDRILAINQTLPVDQVIDGEGGILMPGMVNTHAHLSMIPFRSLQDDLPDRLRLFLFPLEKQTMTQDLATKAAAIGAAESLLSGVTTVLDMYYFADALATTYASMGLRAVVAQTILDQDLCDAKNEEEGFALATAFFETWNTHSLITPAFGPHGTTTVSEDMLKKIQAYAKTHQSIVTVHVSEMDYEMAHFKALGQTPIAYLEQLELLNERFIAAHAIHATKEDCEILKRHGSGIAHCIGSNTKAGKGIAPLKDFVAHGIPVGLGTDGPASGNTLDLFVQMNLVAKMHKVFNHDRSLFKAAEIVEMATLGGARVLKMENSIGSLEVGKKADLVLLETDSVNMYPNHDPYSTLVYSANPSNVRHVWVNGVLKVKDKQLVGHSLSQLKADCTLAMHAFNQKRLDIESKLEKS